MGCFWEGDPRAWRAGWDTDFPWVPHQFYTLHELVRVLKGPSWHSHIR